MFTYKEAILKKLKKEAFRKDFDFDLIYPTTVDAVHHIHLKSAHTPKPSVPPVLFFSQDNDSRNENMFPSISPEQQQAYDIEEDDLDDDYTKMDLDEISNDIDNFEVTF